MVEFDSPKNKIILDKKYYNSLDIDGFLYMLKDPSYCYKFYWLEAIVKIIASGKTETTFDEIINEMICNAWYSVKEYHIHLSGLLADGQVRDGLERAVIVLSEVSNLSSAASKDEILSALKTYEAELKGPKEQLTNMVPYRALSGFFRGENLDISWNSPRKMTSFIEWFNYDYVLLPYILGESSKLKKEVYFQPYWTEMIQENTVAILGWVQYEKIRWLQNNNPEVPGLVYKLNQANEKMRKLAKVHDIWDGILECNIVNDVFTGEQIEKKKYDVDHFIPWSFVMNDELWNLMPMDSSLNSSKSNKLPKWEPFFIRFADNQYLLYNEIQDKPGIHKLYEACFKDNLHSIWASQELYRIGNTKEEFYNILQKNMRPVYDSAKRQGYEIWNIA